MKPSMKKLVVLFAVLILVILVASLLSQTILKSTSFKPGEIWRDDKGVHINAHAGGILFHKGKYYWFGQHMDERSNDALVGVRCYSSDDLYNWKNEGVVLEVSEYPESPIVKGCIIERPKVIYNEKTSKFVMYFHHELRGEGYKSAFAGRAVSDNVTGPYTFLGSGRVNAGSDVIESRYRFATFANGTGSRKG
jgi:hypothetical protein